MCIVRYGSLFAEMSGHDMVMAMDAYILKCIIRDTRQEWRTGGVCIMQRTIYYHFVGIARHITLVRYISPIMEAPRIVAPCITGDQYQFRKNEEVSGV